jgi:hypothetical protein
MNSLLDALDELVARPPNIDGTGSRAMIFHENAKVSGCDRGHVNSPNQCGDPEEHSATPRLEFFDNTHVSPEPPNRGFIESRCQTAAR